MAANEKSKSQKSDRPQKSANSQKVAPTKLSATPPKADTAQKSAPQTQKPGAASTVAELAPLPKITKALYLIPCTLGDTHIEQVLPSYNHDIIVEIKDFIVENIRSARRFLKRVEKSIDIDTLTFYELNRHTDRAQLEKYLQALQNGRPVGIISEAGCPAIADPGADVVAIAQGKGFKVVPLVGPSSIIMSVMASGFNGQSFAFNGYLPVDNAERNRAIKKLENKVWNDDQTQLFIETPYRNEKTFQALLQNLKPNTKICFAAGITCPEEYIRTKTVAQWKKEKLPELGKIPAIFLIGK